MPFNNEARILCKIPERSAWYKGQRDKYIIRYQKKKHIYIHIRFYTLLKKELERGPSCYFCTLKSTSAKYVGSTFQNLNLKLLCCTEKMKCYYQKKKKKQCKKVKCIPAKMQCVNCMQMSCHFLRAHLLPLEKQNVTLKHAVRKLFMSY